MGRMHQPGLGIFPVWLGKSRIMNTNTSSVNVPQAAYGWQRILLATAFIYPVWLLMVGTFDPAELSIGLIIAVLTAWLSKPHLHILDAIKWHPAIALYVLVYVGVFLWALLRSNLDVAARVLSPRLPINPAIVEVETHLRSDLGKLLLANCITLTPGTLTVDVFADRLQIHWIDSTPGRDMTHATASIAAQFEYYLSKFIK